jgi:hypothetical protein
VLLEEIHKYSTGTDGFRALCHQFALSSLPRQEYCIKRSSTLYLLLPSSVPEKLFNLVTWLPETFILFSALQRHPAWEIRSQTREDTVMEETFSPPA